MTLVTGLLCAYAHSKNAHENGRISLYKGMSCHFCFYKKGHFSFAFLATHANYPFFLLIDHRKIIVPQSALSAVFLPINPLPGCIFPKRWAILGVEKENGGSGFFMVQ
jgi:hypothetical protein|nr:hypothetical protein [uncultured Oscillibacter sp.]